MANYERINAASWDNTISTSQSVEDTTRGDEWQVVTRGSKDLPAPNVNTSNGPSVNRGRVPTSTAHENPARQQLPPRLRYGRFQELLGYDEPVLIAEETWRQHGKPAADIHIPTDAVFLGKKYEEIAREQGTFIHTLKDYRQNDSTVEFGIWGAPANVAKARQAISAWLRPAARPSGNTQRGGCKTAARFAKINSLSPQERAEAEFQWLRDVELEKFRQHPPYDMAHHSIGHFHWPADEECAPDEVWGKSYEALDPVRRDCRCYVVWIADTSAFRVMGGIEDVKRALHRIRMAYFQIVARDIGPMQRHVLRVPEGARLPSRIPREPYHDPLGPADLPPAYLLAPMIQSQKCSQPQRQSLRKQAEIQALHVKHLLTNALKQFHYFRGRLELRFRLGRLVLERAIPPRERNMYMLDEYLEMTEAQQFSAKVTDGIGNQELESMLLDVLLQADHLLIPPESIQRTLSDVRPRYNVTFTFEDVAGDICLSFQWTEQIDTRRKTSSLTSCRPRWTQLKVGASRPTQLMNMSLTNLETSLAWGIELLASRALDEERLPPKLLDFASKVSIDAGIMSKVGQPNQRFINHPKLSTLKAVRQEIVWQFDIAKTNYFLECTKFNDTVYDPARPPHPLPFSEDSWSLSLDSVPWQTAFAQNESLPIGERADWDDDFAKWFEKDLGTPDDDDEEEEEPDGFEQLLEKMNDIETLLQNGPDDASSDGSVR